MDDVELNLTRMKDALLSRISLADLHARNPVAHKWKAPFKSLLLRESVSWRVHDLLTQSHTLHQQGHGLGARILLRSAFETLALLIYLNQHMQQVIDGKLDFHVFDEKVEKLVFGSRIDVRFAKAINILTVLEKCDTRYPGLKKLYDVLSESAHPNLEGLCLGYSKYSRETDSMSFSNRWMEKYGEGHIGLMATCMKTFVHEYNDVWDDLFVQLENWIEVNDEILEATTSGSRQQP